MVTIEFNLISLDQPYVIWIFLLKSLFLKNFAKFWKKVLLSNENRLLFLSNFGVFFRNIDFSKAFLSYNLFRKRDCLIERQSWIVDYLNWDTKFVFLPNSVKLSGIFGIHYTILYRLFGNRHFFLGLNIVVGPQLFWKKWRWL